jgi:hypothetical protein
MAFPILPALAPFTHQLNTGGTACDVACPACYWATLKGENEMPKPITNTQLEKWITTEKNRKVAAMLREIKTLLRGMDRFERWAKKNRVDLNKLVFSLPKRARKENRRGTKRTKS